MGSRAFSAIILKTQQANSVGVTISRVSKTDLATGRSIVSHNQQRTEPHFPMEDRRGETRSKSFDFSIKVQLAVQRSRVKRRGSLTRRGQGRLPPSGGPAK